MFANAFVTKILKISKLLPNFKSKKKNQTNNNNNKNPESICSAGIRPCPLTPRLTSRSDLFKGMLTHKQCCLPWNWKVKQYCSQVKMRKIRILQILPVSFIFTFLLSMQAASDSTCWSFPVCGHACLSQLHGQMGKDGIQPSDMIALSLIFFCFLNQLSTCIRIYCPPYPDSSESQICSSNQLAS